MSSVYSYLAFLRYLRLDNIVVSPCSTNISHHQVTATDGGTPPRSATASVVVVIQDVNDNDPVFSPPQYEVELAEDEPPGTPVVTVTATDADEDNR